MKMQKHEWVVIDLGYAKGYVRKDAIMQVRVYAQSEGKHWKPVVEVTGIGVHYVYHIQEFFPTIEEAKAAGMEIVKLVANEIGIELEVTSDAEGSSAATQESAEIEG